jgi:hypothetical protein
MTEAFASALLILFFAAGTFAYSWEFHGKGLSGSEGLGNDWRAFCSGSAIIVLFLFCSYIHFTAVWDIGSAVIFAVIVLANLR